MRARFVGLLFQHRFMSCLNWGGTSLVSSGRRPVLRICAVGRTEEATASDGARGQQTCIRALCRGLRPRTRMPICMAFMPACGVRRWMTAMIVIPKL